MESIIRKAGVLVEAIPYIHSFRRKIFVIKYGGSILDNDVIRKYVLEDIVFLSYVGIRIILVHGGGPFISTRLKESGIKPVFHDGIRVTDRYTLDIVSEELDKLNKKIVSEIKELKGDVTGLKGQENIIHVEKKRAAQELGFVGTIKNIEKQAIQEHIRRGRITVISPMGINVERQTHNVNADEVASAIASSMKAEKLVLLTNVTGVMRKADDPNSLISTLQADEIENLIREKIIEGGMIPKVESCLKALMGGVKKTHIIDARMRHALLLEIFTDRGIGTQIIKQ
ncbi:MAG TPA: acetylglutamate kinase [Candidatus Omnitrophota bacterium]|nr:acetylglutamate kinase [Candidatus Omnitrophota bacterium]HQO58768.1 acetylglutamate kinase [Candidatus Omnitrophota bacterium]HQP12175.1 acetylglutamate kinase [Candidatus Omnitrophota bacterium]